MTETTRHPDDDYCVHCGDEGEDIGLHEEAPLGYVCDACCDGIVRGWCDHVEEFADLGFDEWFKLAYPDRIVKLDWSPEEEAYFTAQAAMIGMTLEEFVVHCVQAALAEYREVNPDVG